MHLRTNPVPEWSADSVHNTYLSAARATLYLVQPSTERMVSMILVCHESLIRQLSAVPARSWNSTVQRSTNAVPSSEGLPVGFL